MSLLSEAENLVRTYATQGDQHGLYMLPDAAAWLTRMSNRPKVVCLCGSTRFLDEFHKQTAIETLSGHIVLSVGVYVRELYGEVMPFDHAGEAMGLEVKEQLDYLHKRKIDMADEIFVLNVNDYIGESTQSEIAYAHSAGVPVRYLEETKSRNG